MTGLDIPGFKVERVIAEGGMSSVYLAVQESLKRRVAIKVLDKIESARDARRFLREARIIASLQHRNIITIHDVGEVRGRHYIAMEYLDGGSLADRIKAGVSPKQALDLLETMAACLDFVHRRGIVHGDIKPQNILFHRDATAKLSDFGIAERRVGSRSTAAGGKAYGSPHYLSPEQAEGQSIDGRSDIYGLGIVFFQMLTGRLPYAADSDVETIVAHLSDPIPLLPEPVSGCQTLLEQMIAKRPQDRVADAAELVKRIRQTRTAMARRGGIIDVLTRPLPAASPGADQKRLSGAHRPSIAWMSATVVILLVFVLGLTTLTQEGARDVTVASASADGSPHSEGGQAPEGVPQPGAGAPIAQAEGEGGSHAKPGALPEYAAGRAPAEAALTEDAPDAEGSGARSRAEGRPALAAMPSEAGHAAAEDAPVTESADESIAAWMQAAEKALAANRLTTPVGDNAYDHYRQVLELAPAHPEASSGLIRIADRYAAMGRRALAADRLSSARRYVRRGMNVRRDHPPLLALREELDAADQVANEPPQPEPPVATTPPPTPAPETVFEFDGTSVTSRGKAGSGNIIKDFKNAWRSVFN